MTLPAYLHPFCKPARDTFLTIERGKGALVWDADGNEYVDGMASLWCVNVGHGRREIVDAVTAQMSTLACYHTFEPFANEPADRLAEEVAAVAPMTGARVFLTTSGSEAVDSAIKLARLAHVRAGRPERTLVLSRGRGYHGVTFGGMAAQGLPPNQEGFGPHVEGFENLPPDDIEAWASFMSERGHEVAAVLAEPVQGAGGVHPPPDGYLAALRRLCDQHGAYLILDEVICAFGRLGEWFGARHYGVVPDMITFAKGVSSGYVPLGGVVIAPSVHEPLEADPTYLLRHGHTYSGHPTCAAAGLANLAVMRDDDLLARAPAIGARLSAGLRAIEADGLVADVRGAGAVWAVGLDAARDAGAVRDGMLDGGVICRPIGPDTLAFCPPLVIDDGQIDHLVDSLASALR
ncbi:MAG TPA: aspartate aminotransferase family protein [Acidimicrobiia bacterium]